MIQLKHLEEDFRFKFRSLLEGHLKLLDEAPINMAGQPVVLESAPPATEETPFVIPASVDEVPEYPPAAPPAVQPESSVALETAAGVPAAATASLTSPVGAEPPASDEQAMATLQPALAAQTAPARSPEPETPDIWATDGATGGTGDTDTAEQASVFDEFDKAEADKRLDVGEASPMAAADSVARG